MRVARHPSARYPGVCRRSQHSGIIPPSCRLIAVEMEHRVGIARLVKRCTFRPDWFSFAVLAAVIMLARHATAQVEWVDPTIGNVGILLKPTRPAVFLPNSMVRVYPIRTDALDDQIKSFPLTISSYGMQELFSIMPGKDSSAAA